MSLAEQVAALEAELTAERQIRRDAQTKVAEVQSALVAYSESHSKAWGRTLDKIGAWVGVKVDHG